MRWFCSRAMFLCSAAIAMCAAVVGFARAQPVHSLVDGLGQCSDASCYMGIIPGRTTWGDALAMFGDRIMELNSQTVAVRSNIVPWPILWRDWNSAWVNGIEIGFDTPSTFPALVAQFGPPCRLSIIEDNLIVVTYPFLSARVVTDYWFQTSFGNQGSLVERVGLFSPSSDVCRMDAPWIDRPWLGFASMDRYRKR
jgi:hypothetical protein